MTYAQPPQEGEVRGEMETAQRYLQAAHNRGCSTYAAVCSLAERVDALESYIREAIDWLPQHPREARARLIDALRSKAAP